MDKMKMLNDEQLENVSGGGNYAPADSLPATHGAHINASELYKNKDKYLNQKFYCVSDACNDNYLVVTLKNIKKLSLAFTASTITYDETILIIEKYGGYQANGRSSRLYTVGGTYTVNSSSFTFYAYE